ncbi:MAG TPA: hypothetical protein VMS86_02175 [Thermoanaerobaculia bacterium]|nr:hypothetical protein [Thermoanaerobaculia bacterium]
MSEKHNGHGLERILYHSTPLAIEEAFTAAAQQAFGELEVHRLDAGSSPGSLASLDGALLVIGHEDTAQSIGTLRELREGGLSSPALLLVSSEPPEFEAYLAELGPAAAFPADGFAPEDVAVCVRALDSVALATPAPAAVEASVTAATPGPENGGKKGAAPASADDGGPMAAATLESIEAEESTLLESLDTLRQRRRKQLDALAKAAGGSQRRLETLKKRLAKIQESLSVEKRQRWEVVLDLRESQERVKEVEERLQRARDGETRRQKEIESLRIELEKRTSAVAGLTRERDAAQQRFEQAQKGLEKKSGVSRQRIEELREETERLREEHAKAMRDTEDRVAGLELELEETRREAAVQGDDLRANIAARDALALELEELRETTNREREQSAAVVRSLEEDGRKLAQRLEQVTQSESGRAAQLEQELTAAVEALERRTEELSKAAASSDVLEQELRQIRAQYAKEKEESQAWIGELEGELERHRAEVAQNAQALAEAQAQTARLTEERDRLDLRLRRTSAESGKLSDLQKELDTLLAELADKEEERVALRTGRESMEREVEEARAALAQEKEESAGRLAAASAERSDLERQMQEARDLAQTFERQMATLRAEVVELEVAREEDAEKLRELGGAAAGASRQRVEEIQQERDRLKRELDALRLDAENTRRALADSDARLRKLQQEKSGAGAEPAEKAGDLAIQQLRADLGSLGD